ncbi:hypothetical protein PtA15_4A496 [Puccinia triticina]|uniref:Uncharacterized protein n=1 Tax=Puccinia triticina TaxID=208348 RepID=A0ABY7CH09_9BASI|nr:uncharacterized protein PtA15_4A496 [Puccinia triticina]WAQ84045.1 hypothetical protein PtA15_4A496 [Puccinia triticina]
MKLVLLYKKEAVLELLRNRLRGPEIFLATEEEVNNLLASILELSENLREELNELTGEQDMRGVMNDEESKLLLLLWSAKADLFVQAVHIQAKKRPLLESKSIGARLGTKLKEKIYKALQARRPAVKKYIDAFNRCFANYVTKFPDQKLSDAADYPLTCDNFVTFEIDHRFWNDGLYYHSKAPWAIDCDVRAGITATLTLSRVQEELQLLAQELCRAVGWGVAHYNRLEKSVAYLADRISQLDIYLADGGQELSPDHVDQLSFGGFSQKYKYIVIKQEIMRRLEAHGALMHQWSDKIHWLWQQCQPLANRDYISDWDQMIDKVKDGNPLAAELFGGVDEEMEETILGVELDDGEDAADGALISATKGETE